MSKEFIFVHRIDKQTPLDHHIPLHMTALHWFESDVPQDEAAGELKSFADKQRSVVTHATIEDLFGPDHDVPVMRLDRTPELVELHLGLLALAKRLGGKLDERWVGAERWSPHVTHQREARLYPSQVVEISDLDLITKRPDGMRELVMRVNLGDD